MSKKFLMDRQKILIYFSKLNELLATDGVELEFFVNMFWRQSGRTMSMRCFA